MSVMVLFKDGKRLKFGNVMYFYEEKSFLKVFDYCGALKAMINADCVKVIFEVKENDTCNPDNGVS